MKTQFVKPHFIVALGVLFGLSIVAGCRETSSDNLASAKSEVDQSSPSQPAGEDGEEATVEHEATKLSDEQIENLVRRSYQYVAMYNVNNKFAIKQGGWNTVDADTQLKDHTMREIARPNNDTLYISALIDLRKDPVILEMPAFDSDYVSLMVTGYDHYVNVPMATRLGNFKKPEKMLFYTERTEGYDGEPVKGVDRIFECTGDFISAVLRIMPHAKDQERFQRIVGQMEQVKVTTLSEFRGGKAKPIDDIEFPAVGKRDADIFENNLLEVMQFVFNHTTFDPQDKLDQELLAAYEPLGVVPGQPFDPDKVAKIDGAKFRKVSEQVFAEEMARTTDEEFVKKELFGKFKPKGQMPLELLLFQSVLGPIGLPATEAVYPAVAATDGKPLNAMHDYVIRMSADELPPTDVFWSLTLYDLQNGFFIPNDQKKYSVGENAGMKLNEEGGIEVYVAAEKPDGVPEENWLPINRKDEDMDIVLRVYVADLDKMKTWTAPKAEKLEAGGKYEQENQTPPEDWREQYAYTLGVQAYVFSFPWSYLPELRYAWVTQKPKNASTPYAPLNHFWHMRTLADADYRDGGSPNYDTLYSLAWLDVGKEPVILSHPDLKDRYLTFQIASMTSDNVDYVGSRTTGSKAGHFAITGPDWKGELPQGVKRLKPSPTAALLIFGRTAVRGPEDVPAANRLQSQYKLTPLSLWGKADAEVPERRDVFKPFDREQDPLNEWRTINRAMTENPPLQRNAFMVELMKTIGVGPGQDVDAMDEATQRGLARAAKDGRALLFNIMTSGYGKQVNGWTYPPSSLGRAGYQGDFRTRGAVQCMGGIISNDPAENIYLNTTTDVKRGRLDGSKRYVLKFEKDGLPEVSEFWSLTMYDMTFNFAKNPIDRYAIGSLKEGYELGEDGSLTFYIQHDSPGKDKEANWLPSPEGEFFVVFRAYGPGKKLLSQEWEIPGLVRIED